MRHYRVTDAGSEDATPSIETLNDPQEVMVHQLPPDERNERIAKIERQLKRFASLEASVKHWEQVIVEQTNKRDEWQARIEESQDILELRRAQLADRDSLALKLKSRLIQLRSEEMREALESLGPQLPPQLQAVLDKLRNVN